MGTYEENIPVDADAEHRSRTLMKEYVKKLVMAETVIPDPFTLKDGWLAEQKGTGLFKWPSVYYTNIEKFLLLVNKSVDLLHRMECEYKEGKAYRYFKCDFVKEIFYHDISKQSKICILKGRVTPSQRTSNTAYHVWAAIEKDGERPGGQIHAAYCTCTAGLLGCCNHVTAMLFRVEAAVRSGTTKPSSTSVLAKWNVPTGCKTVLKHQPISKLTFHKHHYKKGEKNTKEKIETANNSYNNFTHFANPSQAKLLQNRSKVREQLYQQLKHVAAESCFIELAEGKRKGDPQNVIKTLPLLNLLNSLNWIKHR